MRRAIGVVLTLVLVVAGCGDDSAGALSQEERAVADAVVDFIVADEDFAARPLTEDEARCLAETTVRQIGVEGLAEIGVTADSVPEENPFEGASDDKVDAFVEAYFECLDVAEIFAAEFEEQGALSPDSVSCLAEELGRGDLLRGMLRSSIAGGEFGDDPELLAQFIDLLVECLSAEEFAELAG